MNTVNTSVGDVHFGEVAEAAFKQFLQNSNYSKVFLLVDENTRIHCLKTFKAKCLNDFDAIFQIKAGEEYKTIQSCIKVWNFLSNWGGDRKSLLINLGGGVVTDLGGFVASTFKRGIDFINVPTSLLAMVDASVGGKTGVDLGILKNQVGTISAPKMVLVFPEFLSTLDARQTKSGFAEMLKHGLIADKDYWKVLRDVKPSKSYDYIQRSVQIKNEIVEQDPFEKNIRKKLNFGHTLGHAIESYFLDITERDSLLHGEAIAAGMILEGYLSHKLTGLSMVALEEIRKTILGHFKKINFSRQDISIILELLKHDKKNSHGNINFVLLEAIGAAVMDISVHNQFFAEAFAYYKEH